MKRVVTIAVLAAAAALLTGCGGDSSPGSEPAGNANETACIAEIKRQLENPAETTQQIPPQCQGIEDKRLSELANAAVSQIVATTSPTAKPK